MDEKNPHTTDIALKIIVCALREGNNLKFIHHKV